MLYHNLQEDSHLWLYSIIHLVLNMTEEQRLEKNNRIREKGKETREKRKSQVCRVYRVKIDFSHLNEAQKEHLKDAIRRSKMALQ